MGNYQQEYIARSTGFRESKASPESVGKLYDLLYELEKADRTKEDSITLANIYTLLGFHLSAYETFSAVADATDRKVAVKLHGLQDKAKSHQNNFIIKDVRKLRGKIETPVLSIDDFKKQDDEGREYILDTAVVIFNKQLSSGKFKIYLYNNQKIEDHLNSILEYILWLSNCKSELISFYNAGLSEDVGETANDDWYDTLELYSARIELREEGKLFSTISGGDDFMQDHILDIEMEEKQFTDIGYDG